MKLSNQQAALIQLAVNKYLGDIAGRGITIHAATEALTDDVLKVALPGKIKEKVT